MSTGAALQEFRKEVFVGGGFGDCTFLAFQLPLYIRRGYEITIACNPDKEVLFRPTGVAIRNARQDAPGVHWHENKPLDQIRQDALYDFNIPGANFGST